MKLTLENLKENYVILIIKMLIAFLFIFNLINAILKITHHYDVAIGISENKLVDYFYIITRFSYLRPLIISLIPFIGIFIKRKIGWILIQSYFYFLATNLVFMVIKDDSINNNSILMHAITFSILFLIIILMNKKTISKLNYGIEKKELINKNNIALIIGISITTILIYIKAN
ncbi:hypothetical protein [Psychroflexus planctonicus]|uniref:Uncharacterized protein n=1 Tax=Psychroflexus planctonicus TaxID=1526575 RepID=A0ABQ1SFG7_9FLAO|nr:hypothetical protein [Psychroflexus planctonicus]GGE28868.1 hypothetical protein GCM10010832_06880 [Psychroflexus planctonicus]